MDTYDLVSKHPLLAILLMGRIRKAFVKPVYSP